MDITKLLGMAFPTHTFQDCNYCFQGILTCHGNWLGLASSPPIILSINLSYLPWPPQSKTKCNRYNAVHIFMWWYGQFWSGQDSTVLLQYVNYVFHPSESLHYSLNHTIISKVQWYTLYFEPVFKAILIQNVTYHCLSSEQPQHLTICWIIWLTLN